MGKSGFIFLVLTLVAGKLFSQREILNDTIGEKRLINFQGTLIDGYFVFKCETDVRQGDQREETQRAFFYMISPTGEYVKTVAATRTHIDLIGHISDKETITLFFTGTAVGGHLQSYKFYKNQMKKPIFTKWEDKADDDHLISYMVLDGYLHRLSFDTNKRLLYLHKFVNNSKADSSAIQITDRELLEHLWANKSAKEQFVSLKKESKFCFIQDDFAPSYEMAALRSKIYFRNNHLWLVMDKFGRENDQALSTVYELDFSKQEAKKKILPLAAEANVGHNSFLFKDTLIAVSISNKYISMDFFDFQTLTRIRKILCAKGEPIKFKKTNLIKDGEEINVGLEPRLNEKELSRKVFAKLNGGIPVIIMLPFGSNYFFQIGKFEPAMEGKPVVTRIGTIGPMVSSGDKPASKTYYYGQSSMELEFKNHEEEEIDEILRRKTKLDTEGKKTGGWSIVPTKEKSFLIYVDEKKKQIHVEEFLIK